MSDTNSPTPDERPLPDAPEGYDLIRRLGRGGMGDVYLARELASERLVAMKFLRHPGSQEAFERFQVELRALAESEHSNIVRLFASDFRRADPFFTMEYLPRGSLVHPTNGVGPVPAADAVRIVRAVACAVAVAHAKDIVHRDLKPSNILLAADGTPKVVDFGLAKRLDETDPLTRVSGEMGTPGYMPPEQISRRYGKIGPSSDVYGLGGTLYHLLTGRAPFLGYSTEEIAPQVLAGPPVRPRAVRPDVPEGLEAIVLKCLEQVPARRYGSMTELVEDLDRFTAGQPPLAPPFTRWRRLRQWALLYRRGLTGALVAVVLLVGMFVLGRVWEWDRRVVRYFGPTSGAAKPLPASPLPPLVPPELTHEQVVEQLRSGRRVDLVGPKGAQVPIGNGLGLCKIVEPSAPTDARFSLQPAGLGVLELLPDPGIDRYRIRAVLRQELAPRLKNGKPSAGASMGVVLGHRRLAVSQNRIAHALLAITVQEPSGDPKIKQGVRCHEYGVIEIPFEDARTMHQDGGGFSLGMSDERERVLEIDVAPDGITIRYGGKAHLWDANHINPARERTEESMNVIHTRDAPVSVGRWSPRMPVGIWAQYAWVSVLSFSIEPLPGPERK